MCSYVFGSGWVGLGCVLTNVILFTDHLLIFFKSQCWHGADIFYLSLILFIHHLTLETFFPSRTNEPSFCQGPLDWSTWMDGTCLPSKQAWFLTNCACHRSDILGIVKHKEMPPHLLGDSLPLPFHFKRRAYFNPGLADPSCLSFMIGRRFVVIAELSICREMKFSFNPK